MAYVSYLVDGEPRVGLRDGEDVVPLEGIVQIDRTTDADLLSSAARVESERMPLASVTLRPTSPDPRRILCVGLNYRAHIEETRRSDSDYPVLFPKFGSSLIAADAPIIAPPESEAVDYEGELAVVIGRPGRRISEEDAEAHILGYAVANDITMRDFQYRTHQWVQGKAWDGSTPIGPQIVTPDEVDVTSGSLRTVVNGDVVQESDLSLMIFSIPRIIAVISQFTTLEPGDVILTGTPGGVGFRREPQLLLQPGDVVAVEIDGVGRISNEVVAEKPPR